MRQATCGAFTSTGRNLKDTSNANTIPVNEKCPVIRLATDADTDGILTCLRSAFRPYESSYTSAAYEDTVLTRESLHARLKTMSIFVAVTEADIIVGTIACQVLAEGEGHLRGMAVDPEWHGRGISQQLLERAESELKERKCHRLTLDTTEYLKRAIHFYQRNGYRASGKITDFFGMVIHEYVKRLPS